jgi:hypothetical protein
VVVPASILASDVSVDPVRTHERSKMPSERVQNPDRPELNLADQRKLERADRLGILLTSAPKWIALAVIAWQVGLSIQALSGESGALLMRFDRETSAWEIVSWAAGLAGILFGLYNRILLRRRRSGPPIRR